VELLGGVPTLVAGDPLGAVLAGAARLAVLGDWDRVKICPAEDCRWAFFDHSPQPIPDVVPMRVCGNRTKARNWRERARLASLIGSGPDQAASADFACHCAQVSVQS